MGVIYLNKLIWNSGQYGSFQQFEGKWENDSIYFFIQ